MAQSFLFQQFFFELRAAGLKVSLHEWLVLMNALAQGVVEPSLVDFHRVSRGLLVKSEAQFDTFDQVFSAVFRNVVIEPADLHNLLSWLEDPKELPSLSPEQLARLESLSLDDLRARFEERLRDQTERHDGGSRWIGTGGTSPFGHGGANPAGVRVGGVGGGRSAIQIAGARSFRAYRNDRVLDERGLTIALRRLRRLSKRHQELELDVEASIDSTSRNAGELTLELRPPRKNEARVVLLMDVGGSMDPYAELVEKLFSAAHQTQHWKSFEAYAFHNCIYEQLDPARPGGDRIRALDLIAQRPSDTFLIVVGDASMAPTELMDVFGAVDYDYRNTVPGIVWLHRLRRRFDRAVWLNPLPERWWGGWTTRTVQEIFSMFPLTVDGIERAVDEMVRRRAPPLRDLAALYPRHHALHRFDERGI
ncbi:MAG: VWA domain-containing protein [Myxococcales bacterium]|nr:VWA domain-containing protein [Myxococcales bacterium]